jgi:threonine dehydratase
MTPLHLFDNIYFKREDLSITGSAKDRAVSEQIKNLLSQNFNSAVISSTGNAAISAQYYCEQNNIKLTIFVSPHTDINKLKHLKNYQISNKPISDSIKFSKQHGSYLLRQSTDDSAIHGYSSMGDELTSQLPQVSSVFFPVSSGATLVGTSTKLPASVKIFAVQSAYNCPISKNFFPSYQAETVNLTDALTAKYVPLKNKVIGITTTSGGGGIIVSNQEILSAQKTLENFGIKSSFEGALALAGLSKSKVNFDIGAHPVVIISGAKR